MNQSFTDCGFWSLAVPISYFKLILIILDGRLHLVVAVLELISSHVPLLFGMLLVGWSLHRGTRAHGANQHYQLLCTIKQAL